MVLGDGALGQPGGGPYDRIVGAFGIPDSWLSQMAPGGRLVVPLRIVGSVSRLIAFERSDGGGWRSVDDQMCGFVPLRNGIADDPRRTIPLTVDHAVMLPRTESWTSVEFGPGESLEWLFLWLACTQAGRLCRMAVEPDAVESGVVDPMFPASAVAVVGEGELAYLTWRAADGASDRRERAEVGVLGRSCAGSALTNRVAQAIRLWGTTYRQRSVRFEIPAQRRIAPMSATAGSFSIGHTTRSPWSGSSPAGLARAMTGRHVDRCPVSVGGQHLRQALEWSAFRPRVGIGWLRPRRSGMPGRFW